MWRLVLVGATGCNVVLGIDDLEGPPCFRDDFATGSLQPMTWDVFMDGFTPAMLAVQPGALVISAPPNVKSDIGIRKRGPLNLTDSTLDIEVLISGVTNGLETVIALEEADNPGIGYAWVTVGTALKARRFIAGNDVDDTKVIDPTDRFWRIHHDSAAATVEFSVSPNQVDYFVVGTKEGQPPPVAMELRLQAGVFVDGTANPGQVTYEDVTTSGACE